MTSDTRTFEQYRRCLDNGGYLLRDVRGLLEVTGRDRAAWLHNLVTNAVKTLSPCEGTYAFAANVKGRTLFDLNILVLEDCLWLDIDRRWIEKARSHLERYHITEDVAVRDLSPTTRRLGILGPNAHQVAAALAFGNLAAMAWLQHGEASVAGARVRMVRHDFAGLPGAEFIWCENAEAVEVQLRRAAEGAGLIEAVSDVVDAIRIEAGRPASVIDIDEDIVPPETLQIERGISYQKGCYLGQEVIERMRARGVLARKLAGVCFEADSPLPPNTPLLIEGQEIGRTRSGCFSFALGRPLSLAYVKTVHAAPGTKVLARAAGALPGSAVSDLAASGLASQGFAAPRSPSPGLAAPRSPSPGLAPPAFAVQAPQTGAGEVNGEIVALPVRLAKTRGAD